ncbi:MAG: DUF2807 domain-containing protein [Alistipes sp.]|nr:DUF2807 domain-containing protein [Alistipes sp.]
MKRIAYILLATIGMVACSVMEFAKGEVIEKSFTISGEVNGIAVSDGFDVVVDPTMPRGEVRVITHTDVMDNVDIEVVGTTLNIDLNNWALRAMTLKVKVPAYDFNAIAVSGGVDFEWHDCTVASLSVAASGGSDVEITANSEEINIATSGGADVEIDGSCKHLTITASGGSDVDASKLRAEDVEVTTSGGADVDVYATNSLKAHASGGSDVRYGGNPTTKDIKESGGADIKPAK